MDGIVADSNGKIRTRKIFVKIFGIDLWILTNINKYQEAGGGDYTPQLLKQILYVKVSFDLASPLLFLFYLSDPFLCNSRSPGFFYLNINCFTN